MGDVTRCRRWAGLAGIRRPLESWGQGMSGGVSERARTVDNRIASVLAIDELGRGVLSREERGSRLFSFQAMTQSYGCRF